MDMKERFYRIYNALLPYFKTAKVIMTLLTPLLIIIWYARYFRKLKMMEDSLAFSQGKLMDNLHNENVFYMQPTADLNPKETILVRVAQIIVNVLGHL